MENHKEAVKFTDIFGSSTYKSSLLKRKTSFFVYLFPIIITIIVLLESRDVISLLVSEIGTGSYQSFEHFANQMIHAPAEQIKWFGPFSIVKTFSLPFFLADPIFLIGYRIVAGVGMYFFVYRYVTSSLKSNSRFTISSFAFVGALVYLHYPYMLAGDTQFVSLSFIRDVGPLFLLTLFEFMERKRLFFLSVSVVLMTLMTTADPRALVFIGVPSLVLVTLPKILTATSNKTKFFFIFAFILVISSSFLIASPSILPRLDIGDTVGGPVRDTVGIPLVEEAFRYQYSDLENVLRGLSFESTHRKYLDLMEELPENYVVFINSGLFLLPALSLCSVPLIFRNLRKKRIIFYILPPLGLFLSSLLIFSKIGDEPFITKFLFSTLFQESIDSTGPFAKILNMFRTMRFLNLQLMFAYSVLIPLSMVIIFTEFRRRKIRIIRDIALAFVVFCLLAISILFLVNGDLYQPKEIDRLLAYEEVRKKFEEDVIAKRFSLIPPGAIENFPVRAEDNSNSILYHFYLYTLDTRKISGSLLERGHINDMVQALQVAGVKFIVVDEYGKKQDAILERLEESQAISRIYDVGKLHVYSVNSVPEILVGEQTVFVLGGYETFRKASIELKWDKSSRVIPIFLDSSLNKDITDLPMTIVSSPHKSKTDLIASWLVLDEDSIIIEPIKFVRKYSPEKYWSPGDVLDAHHSVWSRFALNSGDYQMEYSYRPSYGFVHTSGLDTLNGNFQIKEAGDYEIFIRILKSIEKSSIVLTIAEQQFNIDTDWNSDDSEFVWIRIGDFHFERENYPLTIFNKKGFNAINILLISPTSLVNEYERKIDDYLSKNGYIVIAERLPRENKTHFSFNNLLSGNYNFIVNTSPLLGTGDLILNIGNQTYTETPVSQKLAKTVFRDVSLTEGPHTGRITLERQTGFVGPIEISLLENFILEKQRPLDWSEPSKGSAPFFSEVTEYSESLGIDIYGLETYLTDGPKWSWTYSDTIPVLPGEIMIDTYTKQQNVNGSHIIVQYLREDDVFKKIAVIANGTTGTTDWKHFEDVVNIPDDGKGIRFVLNAGWVANPSEGPAQTWLGDLKISAANPISDSKIPIRPMSVVIYSQQNNHLENLISHENFLNLTKLSNVKVNAIGKRYLEYEFTISTEKEPILIFPTTYTGSQKLVSNSKSLEFVTFPVYNVFTGFKVRVDDAVLDDQWVLMDEVQRYRLESIRNMLIIFSIILPTGIVFDLISIKNKQSMFLLKTNTKKLFNRLKERTKISR